MDVLPMIYFVFIVRFSSSKSCKYDDDDDDDMMIYGDDDDDDDEAQVVLVPIRATRYHIYPWPSMTHNIGSLAYANSYRIDTLRRMHQYYTIERIIGAYRASSVYTHTGVAHICRHISVISGGQLSVVMIDLYPMHIAA